MKARKGKFAAMAAAMVLVAALAGLLHWQQARLQSSIAAQRLDTARSVQGLVEKQIEQDLDARAQLIAGNQAFVGYVTQAMGGILPGTVADNASIVDLLEERRAQLGLTIAAVIDGQGQLIASRDGISERRDFTREPLFAEAVGKITVTRGLWIDGARVFYVTIVPLAAYGSDAGFLLVGMPLDQAVAKTMADAVGAKVALFATTPKGPAVVSSTLEPAAQAKLIDSLRGELGAAEHRFSARLDGGRYEGLVSPLFGSASVQLVALVQKQATPASILSTGLPTLLCVALALGFLITALALARSRIAKQVGELARIVEYAASTGDFHLQSSKVGKGLLAPLAAAFNHLLARLDTAKRD